MDTFLVGGINKILPIAEAFNLPLLNPEQNSNSDFYSFISAFFLLTYKAFNNKLITKSKFAFWNTNLLWKHDKAEKRASKPIYGYKM